MSRRGRPPEINMLPSVGSPPLGPSSDLVLTLLRHDPPEAGPTTAPKVVALHGKTRPHEARRALPPLE